MVDRAGSGGEAEDTVFEYVHMSFASEDAMPKLKYNSEVNKVPGKRTGLPRSPPFEFVV